MRVLSATIGHLSAASVNAIAVSQAGIAGVPLILTSAPYAFSSPQRIIITSAGNDSANTFLINGIPWQANNPAVTEVLAGANAAAAQSSYDYAAIISITPAANTASTVQVGTNGIASTIPLYLDQWSFAPTSIQVDVTGTVNCTVQQTLDDCNGPSGFPNVNWVNHADPNLVNLIGNVQGNYAYLPLFVRLLLNSGSGSATIKLLQSASRP